MSAAIVGREDELAELAQFLSRDDWPRTLLLEGQPGAGKTTLWEHAVDAARERFHVLAARPLETEAKLAHSGIGDLLDGVHGAFDELPSPQAHALRAALLLEAPDSGGVDQRGVALGFLGVLRALAAERPVLVAVDDLQWLDGASSRVVLSAVRRLAEEHVALLLALRESERAGLGFAPERALPAFSRLAIEGLSLEDLHRLVQDRLGVVLSRPALRTVHATAAGNPLFALELARTLPEGQTAGAPVQVPDSLHELVVARVTAVPAEAKAALLAAAALADPTLALIGAATGGDGAAALGPAVDAELVTVGNGRVRFTHPLLAAAAYANAGPAERRDVHAALAAHVRPEERARHLALAADGPNAEVAAALDEAAGLASARGAPDEAAELLERARLLTPPDSTADALRRAVDAAGHHFEAGDARRARALLDDAVVELPAGAERARALIALARVRSYDDDIRAAVELLEAAVEEGIKEPLVQGRAHEILSGIFFRLRERLAEAVTHAKAALEIAERHDDAGVAAAALGSLVLAEAALGSGNAPSTLAAAEAVGSAGRGTRAMGGAEFQVAVVRMWWEQLDEAKTSFERMLAVAEEMGDESSVPYIHVLLAQTECLRGRFGEAAAHADEGVLRAEQVGQETLVAYALALRALAEAHRGDEEAARSAATRALSLAGSTSGRPAEHFATAALGLLELSLGRNVETVGVLTPLVAFARREELREPGVSRFVPDLVEALVACERLDQAEDHLAWFEANAAQLERASGQAAAARCRGFLAAGRGDLAGAVAALEHALQLHDGSPIPFDRARTLLALGVARRRVNDRREARTTLEEARTVFGSLGAVVWERRAAAELARIGGRAPGSGELTPVERRVVELVAAGSTNREVAAALFLSTRTVEGHLSRVYGKLGVHSRVELARKLADGSPKVT
ncbi:MAG TPA: AAA family ATPase [Gaiellaceae bacterium]|nr:AAA family ATPase [Gaiellaceae bacterium]